MITTGYDSSHFCQKNGSFKINYRGRLLAVDVSEEVNVILLAGPSIDIEVNGELQHLEKGDDHA